MNCNLNSLPRQYLTSQYQLYRRLAAFSFLQILFSGEQSIPRKQWRTVTKSKNSSYKSHQHLVGNITPRTLKLKNWNFHLKAFPSSILSLSISLYHRRTIHKRKESMENQVNDEIYGNYLLQNIIYLQMCIPIQMNSMSSTVISLEHEIVNRFENCIRFPSGTTWRSY